MNYFLHFIILSQIDETVVVHIENRLKHYNMTCRSFIILRYLNASQNIAAMIPEKEDYK